MHDLEAENQVTSNMQSDYGDNKLSKSKELNDTMTIRELPADEYENKIHNLGGTD